MTLAAVWINREEQEVPRLWIATDSRISDARGTLIDQGIKLFEIPVVCSGPAPNGTFTQTVHMTTIGMACAGGTLVYQHVYGTLVPILGNLIGNGQAIPTIAAYAQLAGEIATLYVRSLGSRRPEDNPDRVAFVIGGQNPGVVDPEAYLLQADRDEEGLVVFRPAALALADGDVHFIGQHIDEAQARLAEIQEANQPGAPRDRAALNVIREFIDAPDKPTIGGEVQVGFTVGLPFRQVTSTVPDKGQEPRALQLLNSIDLDEIPAIGPCRPGLMSIITP